MYFNQYAAAGLFVNCHNQEDTVVNMYSSGNKTINHSLMTYLSDTHYKCIYTILTRRKKLKINRMYFSSDMPQQGSLSYSEGIVDGCSGEKADDSNQGYTILSIRQIFQDCQNEIK